MLALKKQEETKKLRVFHWVTPSRYHATSDLKNPPNIRQAAQTADQRYHPALHHRACEHDERPVQSAACRSPDSLPWEAPSSEQRHRLQGDRLKRYYLRAASFSTRSYLRSILSITASTSSLASKGESRIRR